LADILLWDHLLKSLAFMVRIMYGHSSSLFRFYLFSNVMLCHVMPRGKNWKIGEK